MKEIVTKLNSINTFLSNDKKLGTIFFFGLLARTDMEGKWDIVISASNIKENNSEGDLVYVIDALKKEFFSELNFLSQIITLTPTENFIKDVARALGNDSAQGEEVTDIKLADKFVIGKMYVICSNFSKLDLTEQTVGLSKEEENSVVF